MRSFLFQFVTSACLSIIFINALTSQAQGHISWGEQWNLDQQLKFYQMVPLSNEETFVWSREGLRQRTYLTSLNADMTVKKREEHPVVKNEGKYDFVFFHAHDGKLHAFMSTIKDDREQLFVRELDPNTLQLSPVKREIDQVPTGMNNYVPNKALLSSTYGRKALTSEDAGMGASSISLTLEGSQGFRFQYSEDKKLLLAHAVVPTARDEMQKIKLLVMNPDLEVLWSKTVALPAKSPYMLFEDLLLDEEGNVHMIIKEYKHNLTPKKMGVRWDLTPGDPLKTLAVKISDNGEKLDFLPLPLQEDIRYKERNLTTDGDNNTVFIAVAEGTKRDLKGIVSLSYAKVDWENKNLHNGTTVQLNYDLFEQESLLGVNVADLRSGVKGFDDLKTMATYHTANGEVTIVLVEQSLPLSTQQVFAKLSFNSPVIAHFTKEGELKWIRRLPLIQYLNENYFYNASIKPVLVSDALVLLFNDTPDKAYDGSGGEPERFGNRSGVPSKDFVVRAIHVDEDGHTSEMKLATDNGDPIFLVPGSMRSNSEGGITSLATSVSRAKVAKLRLEP